MHKGSLFSASSPTFVCGFVYVGHSDWCEMVPHCGFNLHLSERKKELIPFAAAWMELESIMLSEISQAMRDNTI